MAGVVEIAELAGVSAATVSRALRGLHHVNDETRKKIVDAAIELKHPIRPDLLPRDLVTRTNAVGVIAPYISRWYFTQSINGIEQSLREAGFDLLLYNFSQVDARQRIFQEKLLRGKVDALIIISTPPNDDEFQSLLDLGIPLTLLGFDHDGCNSVKVDDVFGAKIATQHLVDYGHKEIGFISGERDTALGFKVSSDRTLGFLEVLESAGLEFNPDFEVRGDYNMQTAEIGMESFLRRKKIPSAIFCHSDEMAFGAMRAIRRRGMRIPEDISIIGFDDHEMAQYVGLTTVSQPPQFLGQMAAAATIATITKPETQTKHLSVSTSLVIRETTARI